MTTQHTEIFHCQKCGNLVYEESDAPVPECCGEEMVRAVSDLIWEVDEKCFGRLPPKAREILRSMQADHRHLVQQLTAERDRWNTIEDPQESDYAEMRVRIQAVRDLLAQHFAEEEQGGYLHEALAEAPRLNKRASQLCCQHQCLLETLDRLKSHLRFEEPESWKEARSDFGQLLIDLRKHEGAENSLVQSAFTEDVGTTN